jgi:hypothetical protein
VQPMAPQIRINGIARKVVFLRRHACAQEIVDSGALRDSCQASCCCTRAKNSG